MSRGQIIGLVLILSGIMFFIIGVAAFASTGKPSPFLNAVGKFAFMYWFVLPVLGFCFLIAAPKKKKY